MTRLLPHPKNDRQQSVNDFWHCILKNPKGCVATLTHDWTIGRVSRQKFLLRHHTYALKMSVNGASTILGLPSSLIKGPCCDIDPESSYRPSFYAKMLLATSYLCPGNEHQWSVNDFRPSIFVNQRAVWRHWPIIELSAVFLGKNAFGDIVLMP